MFAVRSPGALEQLGLDISSALQVTCIRTAQVLIICHLRLFIALLIACVGFRGQTDGVSRHGATTLISNRDGFPST